MFNVLCFRRKTFTCQCKMKLLKSMCLDQSRIFARPIECILDLGFSLWTQGVPSGLRASMLDPREPFWTWGIHSGPGKTNFKPKDPFLTKMFHSGHRGSILDPGHHLRTRWIHFGERGSILDPRNLLPMTKTTIKTRTTTRTT